MGASPRTPINNFMKKEISQAKFERTAEQLIKDVKDQLEGCPDLGIEDTLDNIQTNINRGRFILKEIITLVDIAIDINNEYVNDAGWENFLNNFRIQVTELKNNDAEFI